VVITSTSSETSATQTMTLKNVAWGDVYLCSGQSNMEYPVTDAFYGNEEQMASNHPNLRLLNLADTPTKTPAEDCTSKASYIWAPSSPSAMSQRNNSEPVGGEPVPGGFGVDFPSAVCYFSARDILLSNPNVPIGIITAAKSGSPIESWMPPVALDDGTPSVYGGNGSCGGTVVPPQRSANYTNPKCNSGKSGDYFYGMISPLTPMRLTGVLWYQGEENDHATDGCPGPTWYTCLFPAMISYWRNQFNIPELPFFYVLLAAGHTAMMREAQYTGAGRLTNTAFASAVDLGAATNEYLVPGHPPRKQEVGRRMSLLARALIYKETNLDFLGPVVKGDAVRVTQTSGAQSTTTVTIPFDVGSNGFLHLNGTGGCSMCCNNSMHSVSPVSLVDPDSSSGTVVRTTSFVIDSTAGSLTASIENWKTSKGRVEVRFLFDNSPQCAVYNGNQSGPDSVYATSPHLGIVAQSWRAQMSIEPTQVF